MKNKYYQIRLSEKEYKTLTSNAKFAKMTRSEYIRDAACRLSTATATSLTETIEILKGIYVELKRQGNNINQVAHVVNTYKSEDETRRYQVLEQVENVFSKNYLMIDRLTETLITLSKIKK